MTFAHPYLLLLLLLLPLLAWLKGRRGQPPAFVYSSVQLVRAVLNVNRSRSGRLLAALRWLALALFIIALAQPRFSRSETKVHASGVDIVATLDMSGSMASEDFEEGRNRLSRLDMAKKVLARFIQRRPNDRIGLVVFASQAYIAAPPTLDHDFLLTQLERLQLGSIDQNQTAIGSGLSTAINRLRELKSKSRIVILMTDGQNNAGKIAPLVAAEAAQALGVKVYTIGVGGPDDTVVVQDFFGTRRVPAGSDVDSTTLEAIARETGGIFRLARDADALRAVYKEIDELEKSEIESTRFLDYRELFWPFALAGLVVLGVEIVLSCTVFRRIP